MFLYYKCHEGVMKRSQAAMEFLLTYGWALVLGILVVSSLTYLGVLDANDLANRFLPRKCDMPVEIHCEDHALYVEDVFGTDYNTLTLFLRNNKGHSVEVVSVEVLNSGSPPKNFGDVLSNTATLDFPVDNLQPKNGVAIGSGSYELKVKVKYKNRETTLEHTAVGEVRGRSVVRI